MQETVQIREPIAALAGRARARPRRPAPRAAAGVPLARLGLVVLGLLMLGSWATAVAVIAHDARRRARDDARRGLDGAQVTIARKLAIGAKEMRSTADQLAGAADLRAALAARQPAALRLSLAAASSAGGWDLLAVTDYLGRVLAGSGEGRPTVFTSPTVEAALTGRASEGFWPLGADLFQVRVAPIESGGAVIGALAVGRKLDGGFLRLLRGGLAPDLLLLRGGAEVARTGGAGGGGIEAEMSLGADEAAAPVTLRLLADAAPGTSPVDMPWPGLAMAAASWSLGSLLVGSTILRQHRLRLQALAARLARLAEGDLESGVPAAGCREARALGAALERARDGARARRDDSLAQVQRGEAAAQLERRMREAAEERLARARRELGDQERLVRLGRLAAELGHEINNPTATLKSTLTGVRHGLDEILGCLQRIADENLPPAERRLFFAALEQAGRGEIPAGAPPPDEAEVADLATHLGAAGCREPEAAARSLSRAGLARWWERLLPLAAGRHSRTLLDGLETYARVTVHLRAAGIAAEAVRQVARSLRPGDRSGPDRDQAVDVGRGLDDALSLLDHEIRGRIRVVREIALLPPVRGDAGELCQVWTNLIHNAAQAMCTGGGTLGLIARQAPGWVVVEVSDTGPGIEAAVRDRIFESQVTTKAGVGGTGLGLAIVRRIVEAHAGRIAVESAPGRTRFEVRLPAAAGAGGPG